MTSAVRSVRVCIHQAGGRRTHRDTPGPQGGETRRKKERNNMISSRRREANKKQVGDPLLCLIRPLRSARNQEAKKTYQNVSSGTKYQLEWMAIRLPLAVHNWTGRRVRRGRMGGRVEFSSSEYLTSVIGRSNKTHADRSCILRTSSSLLSATRNGLVSAKYGKQ